MSQITTERLKIDGLTVSRLLLVILIFLTLGLFGLIGIDSQIDPARVTAVDSAVTGHLNPPFGLIFPSGHSLRYPASHISGIDLRFSPTIPLILIDSNRTMLNPIQNHGLER
jgi:hypothetical protein